MSQHDMVLDDQPGASYRADGNNRAAALVTNNSGPNAPSPTFAHQWWADETTGLLKKRNAANTAWVTVGLYDTANFGAALLLVAQTFQGGQRGLPVAVTYAANVAIDLSLANYYTITLTGGITFDNPTGAVAGQSGTISILQDSTGGFAAAWGANWKFKDSRTLPDISLLSDGLTELAYYVRSATFIEVDLVGKDYA